MIISKEIEFDMGHRVPNHKSKCKNPHGHRYRVRVSLEGDILDLEGQSDHGMVMDFGDVKKIAMTEIHDFLDHKFMYWIKDKEMDKFFKNNPSFLSVRVAFTPTAENIAGWIFNTLSHQYKHRIGNTLKLVKVELWETPTSKAICNGT